MQPRIEDMIENLRKHAVTNAVQPRGGHPMFYELGEEENQLYSDKHYQYATDADPMSNFRLCGDLIHKLLKPGVNPTIAAALCLMSKQIVGVYEIVGEGKQNTIESLEDKLKDIGIYSRIIRIMVRESQEQPKPAVPYVPDNRLDPEYPF
jgi:hypothetical protein